VSNTGACRSCAAAPAAPTRPWPAAPERAGHEHLAHPGDDVAGSTISVAIDGVTAGSATDSAYQTGQIGLGVVGYQTDQFDNLSVTPGTGAPHHRSHHVGPGRQVRRQRQRHDHQRQQDRPVGLQHH